jgi:hypothetical protein
VRLASIAGAPLDMLFVIDAGRPLPSHRPQRWAPSTDALRDRAYREASKWLTAWLACPLADGANSLRSGARMSEPRVSPCRTWSSPRHFATNR